MVWTIIIFGTALIVRLGALALTFRGSNRVEYYDDAKIALNILDGHGYSFNYEYRNWLFYEAVLKTATLDNPVTEGFRTTAVKQPFYALVLTGLFRVFGAKNFGVVFLAHALMSSLAVSLLFLSLQRMAPIHGLALALGTATYPAFVVHAVTVPESTTLLLLLVAALWLCLVRIREASSLGAWTVAGLIAGAAVLTEPVMLPLVALSVPFGVFLERRRVGRVRLLGPAAAVILSVLVVSPWLVRNYLVFQRFPVFKSGMGLVFNWGLQNSGSGSWIPDERMVALEKEARNLTELEEDEAIRRELISRFPSHWRDYVFYEIPHHFVYLWWDVPRYWNDYSRRYLFGRRVPFVLLLILALPQICLTVAQLWRETSMTLERRIPAVSALMLLVTFTLVYTVFGAFHSRYRLPLELALWVFAAGTVARGLGEYVAPHEIDHSASVVRWGNQPALHKR